MFLAAAFSKVVAICAMSHFIHFVLVLEKKTSLPLTSMYETWILSSCMTLGLITITNIFGLINNLLSKEALIFKSSVIRIKLWTLFDW